MFLFRFVETEVERVKVLFEQKEGRLRSERDAALQELQDIKADRVNVTEQVSGGSAAGFTQSASWRLLIISRSLAGRLQAVTGQTVGA